MRNARRIDGGDAFTVDMSSGILGEGLEVCRTRAVSHKIRIWGDAVICEALDRHYRHTAHLHIYRTSQIKIPHGLFTFSLSPSPAHPTRCFSSSRQPS